VCALSELTTVIFTDQFSDNITYYKCDVTKLEEVEAVAKKVIEEVCHNTSFDAHHIDHICRSAIPPCWSTMLASSKGSLSSTSHLKILGSPYPCSLQDKKPSNLRARTFDVNALAHFWTLKTFLPEMIRNKAGHIVSYPHPRRP
jgi:NAD(P)-dependent dehydrogenase (short-subunit alcohol dehydrogenase family)